MPGRRDRGKDVEDRLSRRFENDDRSEDSECSERSEPSEQEQSAEHAEPSDRSKSTDSMDSTTTSEPSESAEPPDHSDSSEASERSEPVQNVKEEWNGHYVYLPDDVSGTLDTEFQRLVYECGRDLDWKPKKNRHYHPLVVTDGVTAVEEMSPEEFRDRLDELGLL